MSFEPRCNVCYGRVARNSRSVITTCGHFVCSECRGRLPSNQTACIVCKSSCEVLTLQVLLRPRVANARRGIRLTRTLQDSLPEDVRLHVEGTAESMLRNVQSIVDVRTHGAA